MVLKGLLYSYDNLEYAHMQKNITFFNIGGLKPFGIREVDRNVTFLDLELVSRAKAKTSLSSFYNQMYIIKSYLTNTYKRIVV